MEDQPSTSDEDQDSTSYQDRIWASYAHLMREPPRTPDFPEDEYVWVPEAMGWCPREEPGAWKKARLDIDEFCDEIDKEQAENPDAHKPISISLGPLGAPPARRKSRREQPGQLSLFGDDAPPANESPSPDDNDEPDEDGFVTGYP